ncbi:uncharacterized protein LOC129587838 [Paramacrobiotus metropolitanus]|uniref:uncharacterized protein LOC129587838 n=1 Tax=Paramacrobiotus metropolitanus TaxID=2943436 RepID=UPI002445D473|nr:uncharacterized protein LOC129587838 [Paramacrobiotus metropolitanus]
MTFARSFNCPTDSMCCFQSHQSLTSIKQSVTNTGGCTPVTEPDIHNGQCRNKNELVTQCESQRFAKSSNCAADQFCCFAPPSVQCTPSTAPSVNNGVCVNKGDLSKQCKNQAFSKSSNCSSSADQFCCFDRTSVKNMAVSGGNCVPNTDKSVIDGVCLNPDQLTGQCINGRFSKSDNCDDNQFCCFDNGASDKGTASAGCSPATEPDVTNGVCVNRNQLTSQCGTKRFAKSTGCSPDQFCCFDTPTAAKSTGQCTPNSQPTINTGTCINRGDLTTQCKNNKAFSKSVNCSDDQFCCFDASNIANKLETGTAMCSPNTAPDVKNGMCVDKSQLHSQCNDLRISKSSQCSSEQFCCFEGDRLLPDVVIAPKTRVCRPSSDPASSGKCVARSNLMDKCGSMTFSKSGDCSPDEFCCFENNVKQIALQTCSPSSDTSVHDGWCVAKGDLQTDCENARVSKSGDCRQDHWCCFKGHLESSSPKIEVPHSCTPIVEPTLNNGTCVEKERLREQCSDRSFSRSTDCKIGQMCCFNRLGLDGQKETVQSTCTPASAPDVHNGLCLNPDQLSTQCMGQRFSKSNDCGRQQFCCFANPEPDVACTPITEPTVTNGTCASSAELATKCADLVFAKSDNCDKQDFCCFTNPVSRLKVPTLIAGSCSPNSEPQVTNGVCTNIRDLKEKCGTQRLSKSINCADNQFCCFASQDDKTTVKMQQSGSACIPTSSPNTKEGTCLNLDQITTQCQNKRLSKSPNCNSQQFCCFTAETKESTNQRSPCVPNSDTTINNGQCMPLELLESQCQGMSLSKSENCPIEEFCCFNRNMQNKQSPPDFVPTGSPTLGSPTPPPPQENTTVTLVGSLSGAGCSPNNHPDVTSGTCIPANSVAARCAGKQFDRSKGCADDNVCCYTPTSNTESIQTANQCAPETDPTITNGVCLDESQLAAQCAGRSFARSFNCATGQKCCFDRNNKKDKISTDPDTSGLQVAPAVSGIRCSPNSQPEVTNGTCMKVRDLRMNCLEKRASPSEDCPRFSWCCFDAPSSTNEIVALATTTTTAQPALTVSPNREQVASSAPLCIPMSSPFSNGFCLNMDKVNTQCQGQRLSKSVNCAKEQFCCFQTEPDKEQQLQVEQRAMCIPSSDPTVVGGRCTNAKDLANACANQALSKSENCEADQFCCFTRAETVAQNKVTTAGCSPSTESSVINGTCLDANQLVQQCSTKRFAKSQNCATNQFCCFDMPTSVGGQCVPETDASVTNGQCVGTNQLSAQCASKSFARSANCAINEKCCFDRSSTSNKILLLPAGTCSPSTDPSVTSGVCLNVDQLTAQCGTSDKRFSKSENCNNDQFCCFGNEDNKIAGRGCSPKSEPQINNGSCLDVNQLVGQCRGKAFSKSQDCDAGQFCCFDLSQAMSGTQCSPQTEPASKGMCVSETQLNSQCGSKFFSRSSQCGDREMCCFDRVADKQNVAGCSPVTNPAVTNGACLTRNQLTPMCSNKRFAKSQNCPSDQFCCFDAAASTSSGGQCIPETNPTASGQCIATAQLSAQCASKTFSRSSNCGSNEKCCFDRTATKVDATSAAQCSPETDPSITDGACLDKSQLVTQCSGKSFARSFNCGSSQVCCFDRNTQPVKVKLVVGTCRPSTDPTVMNGACLNVDQLTTQCGSSDKRFSKSDDCGSDQFCCFGNENADKATGSCSPVTEPAITNGTCLNANQLTAQCSAKRFSKSKDCDTNQFCCFDGVNQASSSQCSPQTAPTVTNGVCVNKDQLSSQCGSRFFSQSSNCGSGQMCCFDREATKIAVGGCSPSVNPSVTNGTCLNKDQLAPQCGAKRFAKSTGCADDQFCCYDFGNVESIPAASQCVPETDASVMDGTCVPNNQLNQQCGSKSFARSFNCASNEKCCFNRNKVADGVTGSGCSPMTNPSVTNGTCLNKDQLPSQCAAKRFAKSTGCADDQFCCFDFGSVQSVQSASQCVPETDPSVTDGKCVASDQLTAQCGTKSFARSFNCAQNEKCCFDRNKVSTGVKIDFVNGSNINLQVAHCTPNSEPTINNGICLNVRELSVHCVDKFASPSPDCPRLSWCCFENPNAKGTENTDTPNTDGNRQQTTKSCTPNSDPTVHDGMCVQRGQLNTVCRGGRSGKSPDCASSEFCCFNITVATDAVKLPPLPSCTPNTDSSVHDGQCMKMRELSVNCIDRRAAPSLDCAFGQWCCFGESTSDNTSPAPVTDTVVVEPTVETPDSCAPNKNKALRGQCMTLRDINANCTDRQAGPSEDCEFGTWCCYVEPGKKFVTEKESMQAAPVVETPQVVAQVTAGQACVPNADPNATDGTCMPTKDLRIKCRNRRVSKSPQCKLGHWCCFASAEPLDFAGNVSPVGRSLKGLGTL